MKIAIGSEIYNHLLLDRLKALSQVDALTGLNNRRAMLRHMETLAQCPGQPYGVINIDLNGLKGVNDRDGHEAGDQLLIQAAELLGKVLYRDDLFRTGGDEFVVIIGGIGRDTFDMKLQRLKSVSEKHGLSMAVGAFWSDGATDLKTGFRQADTAMYADKAAYYRNHPANRR